ncbi:GLUCAN SYNTHASE-LIKE 9 family protein [Dorcoceras hygrometricum]|uniref:GLUCAN SYNTHASE-LIKE 9 family protein n=1 Tax=Dorcoceras hygrometricum TaxID=472368 RepID=A0A2Z7C8X8_9LAMI|nr:GLUCAN SYNTHASE-LIKE 9 family protein [Dorcoceras hygrometricum]
MGKKFARGTLSSADDEDQINSDFKRENKKRALNSSMRQPARSKDQLNENQNGEKLANRGTLSSEDDEDQFNSGCKREEKKRALNNSMRQPARSKDQLSANQNGEKLASWLRSRDKGSLAHPDLVKSEIIELYRSTPNSRIRPVHTVPLTNPDFHQTSRTRVQFSSYLMLAKRRRISSTQPTPNLIHIERHHIANNQPVSTRVIQNDIVSPPYHGNPLKCARDRSGHPDLTQI